MGKQRQTEKKKERALKKKEKKRTTCKAERNDKRQKLKKNTYKIGAHYVFVYFQNVAKLNH